MKLKKIAGLSIVFLLMFGFFGSSSFATVLTASDIPSDHWALDYINIALDDGWAYVKDGKFKPDEPATREHVVYMIVKVWEEARLKSRTYGPLIKGEVNLNSFNDGDTISRDVIEEFKLAIKNELIRGYAEDITIKPLGKITRAEMATLLERIITLPIDNSIVPSYKDQIDDWCYDTIINMTKSGLIKGYDDGTFKPSNNITYAEVVTMLVRWAYGEDYNYIDIETIDRLTGYTYTGTEAERDPNVLNNRTYSTYYTNNAINTVNKYFQKELGEEFVELITNEKLIFEFAYDDSNEITNRILLRGILVTTDGNRDIEVELGSYVEGLVLRKYEYLGS